MYQFYEHASHARADYYKFIQNNFTITHQGGIQMKLKKNMRRFDPRTCTECKSDIPRGQKYGKKTKSIPYKQTLMTDCPKEEVPDWAWQTVYFKQEFDFCEKCCIKKGWV